MVYVAVLIYASLCLKKVLAMPSLTRNKKHKDIQMSPLKKNKIKNEELRTLYISIIQTAYDDRNDYLQRLKSPSCPISIAEFTAARANTFARLQINNPLKLENHCVSRKMNDIHRIKSLSVQSMQNVWAMFDLPK